MTAVPLLLVVLVMLACSIHMLRRDLRSIRTEREDQG